MMGPLPPSLVRWLTSSTLVLLPAAPARRWDRSVMVRRRWKLSALSRLSTTWMISSTNPSIPTNARSRLARSTPARSRAAVCSRNSSGCNMGGIKNQSPKIQNHKIDSVRREPVAGGRIQLFAGDPDNLQDALQLVVAEEADV